MKIVSEKVFTSFAVILGINNKKPQVTNERTEYSKPLQSHHPVKGLIETQLN